MIAIKYSRGIYIFPVTPSNVGPDGGDAKYDDVQVFRKGTVPFFTGTDLKVFSWTSFFTNKATSYTEKKANFNIEENVKILDKLKDTGEIVTLLLTDINLTIKVQVRKFKHYQESIGFREYSIELTEYRKLDFQRVGTMVTLPRAAKSNTNRPTSTTNTTTKKTSSSSKSKSTNKRKYIVKKGDTLPSIAKKYRYKDWKTLYEKNKGTIGANPKNLKVGMVLYV